jgi:hypothetical protein
MRYSAGRIGIVRKVLKEGSDGRRENQLSGGGS